MTAIRSAARWTLPLLLLFIGLQGCAVCLPSVFYDVKNLHAHPVADLPVTIHHVAQDAAVLPLVEASVRAGLEKASRWGTLLKPVKITIYPNHLELEKAVHRRGYPWLKAWATDTGIALQSPRSWPLLKEEHLFQLMAHELTHVVHYQNARITGLLWARKDPFWFGEGLASYTAGQDDRRYERKTLRRKLRRHGGFDPLAPSPDDIRVRHRLAYSSAHHLVAYLIDRFGEEPVRDLLARMAEGASFKKAFAQTYGITPEVFREQWLQWLEPGEGAPSAEQSGRGSSVSVVRFSGVYYDGGVQG